MSRFPRNVGGYERTEPAGEWVVACESVHGKLFPEPMARITEPIVRCRDCKHFDENATPRDRECPDFCRRLGVDMAGGNGFCAWGEPREVER